MGDLIRFGLIGCGRVSFRHIQSLHDLADHARLLAVADVVEGRAQRAAAQAGAEAYTDYRRLLDRPDIEVVNICTPSGLHPQMAIEAMQAGKHVILEKPMALSLAEADRILQTVAETGRKL